MTTFWRIEMLGGLRLQLAEAPGAEVPDSVASPIVIRFRSRQASALLAFLAYFPGSHGREALAEMLWPDHEPHLSRAHLRVVLASLRQTLEAPGDLSGPVFLADRHSVGLNFHKVATDVAEFETALQEAAKALSRAAQSAHLERAVECYRGSLLAGSYDEWIVPEAQRLEEGYFAALRRLIAGSESEGDLESALHLARRGASVNALREDVARDLMRLYMATGQPALALRQFRELERSLKQALNTVPGPQTRELRHQIESESHRAAPLKTPRLLEEADSEPSTLPTLPPHNGAEEEMKSALRDSSPSPDPLGDQARLPPQWTRFFGREADIATVIKLLQGDTRLVTLVGMGGSGKTRLALEIAQHLAKQREKERSALWFVPLADVADARFIAGEIAGALRLPLAGDVAPLARVCQALGAVSNPVLILDNFEHLLPAGAAPLQELLSHVPPLQILVTSRRKLGIEGESTFEVPMLPIPSCPVPAPGISTQDLAPEALASCPSVQLFHDRARAAQPNFRITKHNAPAVAKLCARLEGLPLAIELCAARAGAFSPSKMLVGLERRLDFLSHSAPASTYRHPTLRAAMESSYALLWPELARFFAQLGVFRGGFTPQSAAQVAQEPHAAHFLEQLRAASLVVREAATSSPFRFRLLETVREFAAEQLCASQKHDLQRRHAGFYRDLTQSETIHVMAAETGRRVAAFARLQAEHLNLRAALHWSLEHEPQLALHLVDLTSPFWGDAVSESQRLAQRALEGAPDAPPGLISAVLGIAAIDAQHRGDYAQQRLLSERRLALMRAQGDAVDAAWALFHLGAAAEGQGDFEAAARHFGQALGEFRLWEHEGSAARQNVAWTLDKLGECAVGSGDLDAAQAYFEACAGVFERNDDRDGVASALSQLGSVARQRGDFPLARRLFDQSYALEQELNDGRAHPWRRYQRARLDCETGDWDAARHGLERALRQFWDTGILAGTLRCLLALGSLGAAQGDATGALFLLGCEAAKRQEAGCALPPDCRAARERALQEAQGALGQKPFQAAYESGQHATLQQAVARALRHP